MKEFLTLLVEEVGKPNVGSTNSNAPERLSWWRHENKPVGTSRFGPASTRQQQSAEGKRLLSRVRHTLIHFQALALASYETWDRLLICSVSPFPH